MKMLVPFFFGLCWFLAGCDDASVVPIEPNPPHVRANLVGLTVSPGTLSPAFDSSIQAYSIDVPYETDSMIITPFLPVSSDLAVAINGIPVQSGAATAVALARGGTVITLAVQSKSDADRFYTLYVLRADGPSVKDGGIDRRIYLNDRAAADSLAPALIGNGVKFVLQPGKTYRLSLATARSGDSLDLFYYGGDQSGFFRTVAAISDGSHEVFTLASDQSAPRFFAARLADSGNLRVPGGIGGISLTSDSMQRSDTLRLRLLFIRKLKGLPDSLAKAAFAGRLFDSLGAIFSRAGITIKGNFEIIEPESPRMVFPYDRPTLRLPGARAPDCAHLYLIDSITYSDPGTGLLGTILGFAPREAVDLAEHEESRVLLANPLGMGMDISGLAVTAAHELGHLLGLRHTVSTRRDLIEDDDESNREDGFPDTRFCLFDEALGKTASEPSGIVNPGSKFCLRTRGNPCSMVDCEIRNLMFPVDCGLPGQWILSKEQSDFVKRSLANYRR